MTLLTLRDAHLAYGHSPLLDGAELAMGERERLGLIGRNGAGKSTLLRVIVGLVQLDEGEVAAKSGLRVAFVEQEPQLATAPSLRASLELRPGAVHAAEQREYARRLSELMDRFRLDPQRPPDALSGGERKRAALAHAFALGPQLLLLDEPTNHLDIDGIELTEELLLATPAAIVITHDREFLDRTTTRIVELDRGALRSYPGNFARYEERKQAKLESEAASSRRFDKLLAQEEVWIRKGVEARRTRNEGRVRRLERLRSERAARRERPGRLSLGLDAGERSGRLVAELTEVTKRFDGRAVIDGLSLRIMRGDRIGLIGPNGAGKSTLIRIMLGELQPDAGAVRLGTGLEVAYFDQMRAGLDPERTVAEMASPGSDWVQVGGERKHVMSYLADFLFAPERAQSPVRMLSGGERNRLLLARLFARPANLLVLDEPTNDLDIDSLELLEQTLQDYAGTVLLVSHDRRFLDNIVTQTLVARGSGRWSEHVGGYSDWIRERDAAAAASAGEPRAPARSAPATRAAPRERTRGKLSYNAQRELDALPALIETLEREQAELIARMSAPDYHRLGAERLRDDRKRAEELEAQLAEKFARWEALEEQRGG